MNNDEIRIIHLKYTLFITLEAVITLKEEFLTQLTARISNFQMSVDFLLMVN